MTFDRLGILPMLRACSCGIALIAMIVGLWAAQAADPADDILFAPKAFSDFFGQVYIAGTLTGEGVAYKNNTRAITCFKDLKHCLVTSIDQIGPNLIGRMDAPPSYPVITWDDTQVIASSGWPIFSSGMTHCRKTTIVIRRKFEAADWIEEPINRSLPACKDADRRTYTWTIEDPRHR